MMLAIKAITFIGRFLVLLIWTAYLEGNRAGESPEPLGDRWHGPTRPWGPAR